MNLDPFVETVNLYAGTEWGKRSIPLIRIGDRYFEIESVYGQVGNGQAFGVGVVLVIEAGKELTNT
jgi:hypothetical protein